MLICSIERIRSAPWFDTEEAYALLDLDSGRFGRGVILLFIHFCFGESGSMAPLPPPHITSSLFQGSLTLPVFLCALRQPLCRPFHT